MLDHWAVIFGYIGSILSSITFIPQVYKTWKTKRVTDLSLTMLIIVLVSTIVWLVYGIILALWPVVMANAIICVLSVVLLIFKFTFD